MNSINTTPNQQQNCCQSVNNNHNTSSSTSSSSQLDYYKENINLDYTNKDGDTFSFSYSKETLSYKEETYTNSAASKNGIENAKSNELSDGEQIRNRLKDEYMSYKELIVKSFVESNGGIYKDSRDISDVSAKEVTDLEAAMPEYWNAENTSQRIVDFATSFLGAFEGEDSEFYDMIVAAVEDGFSQAKEALGGLKGTAGALSQKTMDLTMEKLEAFRNNNQNEINIEQLATTPEFTAVA